MRAGELDRKECLLGVSIGERVFQAEECSFGGRESGYSEEERV